VIGSPTIGGIICGEGGKARVDFSHTDQAVSAVFLLMEDGLGTSICGTFSTCD
jgi:nucleoside-diphosphate-sugar epimerase